MMVPARLFLASRSPRRRRLLVGLVAEFDCLDADIDETPRAGETGPTLARRLAREKAQCGATLARQSTAGPLAVLAADTVVCLGPTVLGKPEHAADHRRMLRLLGGTSHEVHTAVALAHGGKILDECVTTRVWFRPLADAEIDAYWRSGEPADKAGGYAIQGLAGRFVARIDGSYSAVVGLPLLETERMLAASGIASEWKVQIE